MGRSKLNLTVRSLFVSYLLAALLLAALAFLLYRFHLEERTVSLAVNGIYVLTCFLGGFHMGKGARQRRFFWGLLLGCLYFAVLFAASCLAGRGLPRDLGQLAGTLVLCAASGCLGGMFS